MNSLFSAQNTLAQKKEGRHQNQRSDGNKRNTSEMSGPIREIN